VPEGLAVLELEGRVQILYFLQSHLPEVVVDQHTIPAHHLLEVQAVAAVVETEQIMLLERHLERQAILQAHLQAKEITAVLEPLLESMHGLVEAVVVLVVTAAMEQMRLQLQLAETGALELQIVLLVLP
jgi:hypothetical protein